MRKVCSCSGEKDRPKFRGRYNDVGIFEVVPDGSENVYDDIQALTPTCDLQVIVERYLRTGDSSLINKTNGFYADIADMPTNYAQMVNFVKAGEDAFYQLPLEIREKFDSPVEYYTSLGIAPSDSVTPTLDNKDVITDVTPDCPSNSDVIKGGVVNE